MNLDNMIIKIKLGFTNCYLIKYSDNYILIDTSYYDKYNRFKRILIKNNIMLSNIKYVFLTHHHDDHAGFLNSLLEESGAILITHSNSIQPLRNGESENDVIPINRCVKVIFSFFKLFHKDFKFPPVNVREKDIIIDSDDIQVLNDIGIDGKILYTPGHTKDSISIILADGSAFVGDAAMNFLMWAGTRYRPIFIENINEVFSSWEKIIKNGAKRIYPAHGNPFSSDKLKEPI